MNVTVIRVIRPHLRADDVARVTGLAPPPPPCFGGDVHAWHEYLSWCLASAEPAMNPTRSSTEADGEERLRRRRLFNDGLNFCDDCERGVFKVRMERAGLCRPDWLKAREWDTSNHPLLEAAA